jgi:hypothetical protein
VRTDSEPKCNLGRTIISANDAVLNGISTSYEPEDIYAGALWRALQALVPVSRRSQIDRARLGQLSPLAAPMRKISGRFDQELKTYCVTEAED